MDISPILRHERIALSFSGGKDSLAVAHLLRPHWDRITFYHLDAGDLLPEVAEIVSEMEAMAPRFVRVETDSRAWSEANGLPSDLVPHTGTQAGMLVGGRQRIVGRYDCCGQNLWLPMLQRMVEDKITLVIRGTKRCDLAKLPAGNGPSDLFEIWLPIIDWSHDDVFAYLRSVGAPICRVYQHVVNSPECATCSAWTSESRASYLAQFHPGLHAEYARKLRAVAGEVAPVYAQMHLEIEAL